MANPRKFSEKIALHNQKQAEETAAFEAILRDVSAATQRSAYATNRASNQHLHIQQNIMHQYRGGSLPNVNQMASSNAGMDMQNMENMRGGGSPQSRAERMHPRDRGRQIGPLRSRPFQMEKSRADCSPYGSAAFLSPPPDTSWRRINRHLQGVNQLSRTNSDSAIHSSSSMGSSTGDVHCPYTPPVHRRIHEVVENSAIGGDMLKGPYPWDPKKLQQRPKSCEVPNINIFPSLEQDSQVHIPISNNTGSLPDLTIFQVQSPLTTPLDVEDQQQTYGGPGGPTLSPNAHMNMGLAQQHPNGSPQHSPGSQRRRMNPSGPSPLVLTGNGGQPNMRLPLSPPDGSSGTGVDITQLQLTPRIRQEYMLYMQQHHLQQQRLAGNMTAQSPSHPTSHSTSHNHHQQQPGVVNHVVNHVTHDSSGAPRVPPTHMGPVPKVCVTSHENDPPEPSLTQYRNAINETGCQSPTSPHSQTSYSPSQSPGLSAHNTWNNFEMDPYHTQQQQQTNALQQQFEHFNMIHDTQQHQVSTSSMNDVSKVSSGINTSTQNTLCFTQANNQNLSGSQDFNHHHQQQQQQHNTDYQQQYFQDNSNQSQMNTNLGSHQNANNKIPEIILSDGSFDADFFNVADVVPLDFDGFQMLADSTVVTDADTENSFRLDQL